MKKPTRQQTFDAVARHLFKQGRMSMDLKSGDVVGSCRYRSKDGCRCAIGAVIPDDRYDPRMEGLMADALLKNFPEVCDALPLDGRFLVDLQQTHDEDSNWLTTDTMQRALERTALAHRLKPAIVHTLSFADR